MRAGAVSERRAQPAAARAPGAALSAGIACRDAWRLPSAAGFRWIRCATNTRRSWSRRATRRRAGCASSPKTACAGVSRRASPAKVASLVEHELRLIAELAYEPFFLTVHDVVRFARGRGILCQGRGSAANSVVCYCARHHRGRSRADEHAVRALRLARAQRAARHRRRLRAPAARGGDPVCLREIRPRARRARRHGDLLPHEKRAARRRQGARHASRRGRRARQELHVLGPETRTQQYTVRARGNAARLSAPSVAARGRLRHLARAARRAGADRERRDARAHRDPVGQGRPRGARPAEGRLLALGMLTAIRKALGDDRHRRCTKCRPRIPRSTR